MAANIPLPELTARDGREAMEVLLEQERILRYEGTFGSKEALRLGLAAVEAAATFSSGVSITITRESDGVRIFQWVADDKDGNNLIFAEGKRQAALKAGHAGPWRQLELAEAGDVGPVWNEVPESVPACGAFPIRVGDTWVATIAVSGLWDGEDHEVILRALERVLDVSVPRWTCGVL